MEQRADMTIAVDIAAVSCDCSAEAVALLNSLNNVKADVLSLKQSYAAVESVRSSELIQSLKSTVLSLKVDLSKLSTAVSYTVTNISFAARRIESGKKLRVANPRTEIRSQKDSVRDKQNSLHG